MPDNVSKGEECDNSLCEMGSTSQLFPRPLLHFVSSHWSKMRRKGGAACAWWSVKVKSERQELLKGGEVDFQNPLV